MSPPAFFSPFFDTLFFEKKNQGYIPTHARALLHSLQNAASFTLADFDYLPSNNSNITNAPVVQDPPHDYGSEVLASSDCDIMFPTHFESLAAFISSHTKISVMKNDAFMRAYADDEALAATRTQDGYNPMVSDFINTSILLSSRAL